MPGGKSRKLVSVPKHSCTKNHQMPKAVVPIVNALRDLEFVVCVNPSSFKPSSKPKGVHLIGHDDVKKSYIVKVNVAGFEQRLYVRPKDGKEDYHKKAIENISY